MSKVIRLGSYVLCTITDFIDLIKWINQIEQFSNCIKAFAIMVMKRLLKVDTNKPLKTEFLFSPLVVFFGFAQTKTNASDHIHECFNSEYDIWKSYFFPIGKLFTHADIVRHSSKHTHLLIKHFSFFLLKCFETMQILV